MPIPLRKINMMQIGVKMRRSQSNGRIYQPLSLRQLVSASLMISLSSFHPTKSEMKKAPTGIMYSDVILSQKSKKLSPKNLASQIPSESELAVPSIRTMTTLRAVAALRYILSSS